MNKTVPAWAFLSAMCPCVLPAPSTAIAAAPPGAPLDRASYPLGHRITFDGAASGGTLVFVQTPERNAWRSVSIETTPGEGAESVAQRMTNAINGTTVFGWRGGGIKARGATFGSFPGGPNEGNCIFAGTETGLGIPPPPKSLTANYDPGEDRLVLRWVNPPGGYDRMAIVWDSFGAPARGEATEHIFHFRGERRFRNPEDLGICVVGYRNGIPSNAAAIHLKGNAQEESIGLPFTAGVAPNWTPWTSGEADAPKLAEEKRGEKVRGKSFFQRIGAARANAPVGTWRKFLGLTPGHTYRVSAWMSTDTMDAAQADWSFSLHAVPDDPDGGELSAQQLAGLAVLPGGGQGPEAGRIAHYHPGVTTNRREFALATTDAAKPTPGRAVNDVTLPPGVTSITVWVRYTCSDPDAPGVAFDHLRLEDITPR